MGKKMSVFLSVFLSVVIGALTGYLTMRNWPFTPMYVPAMFALVGFFVSYYFFSES